jgi:D-sedoheptulose 7-phosphate isomerase
MKKIIIQELNSHLFAANQLSKLSTVIETSAKLCIDCINNNGKVLIFGNGGSAADAQHFAAELVGRFKNSRKGLPAVALTTDSSALTSIGNDFGFKYVFQRQIEALANKGDVVIGISTSGQSKNVNSALKLASILGCETIGLSGEDAGEMINICNLTLAMPSFDTPRIQELHIIVIHIICHLIDQKFQE